MDLFQVMAKYPNFFLRRIQLFKHMEILLYVFSLIYKLVQMETSELYNCHKYCGCSGERAGLCIMASAKTGKARPN